MTDVFISYAHEDRDVVRAVSSALRDSGISVFFDENLMPGDDFEVKLAQELADARAVIVIWSSHSVVSRSVLAEAAGALKRKALYPVLIDDAEIPARFETITYVNAPEWKRSVAKYNWAPSRATEISKSDSFLKLKLSLELSFKRRGRSGATAVAKSRGMWVAIAAAAAILCAAVVYWKMSRPEVTSAATARGSSGFIGAPITNASRIVVFVHGVLGNANDTWTSDSTGAYWPRLLRKDALFTGVDVFVYDYGSPLVSAGYTIDELAEDFRRTVDRFGVFANHKQVIFLCHSMGGLVVRAFLLKYFRLASQVPMIYFFATPTTGSDVANLVRLIRSNNPQFPDMSRWKDAAYVGNLVRQWQDASFSIASFCAYETKDTAGIRVVEQSSATNLCNRPLDPIDRDHIHIVKPEDENQTPYVAFRNAYQKMLP